MATRPTEVRRPRPKPDLTLIDLVGGAIAINRKVDPDRPVLVSLQRITSQHLIYDRRPATLKAPLPGSFTSTTRPMTHRSRRALPATQRPPAAGHSPGGWKTR